MYSVGIDVGGTYLKVARLGPLGRVGSVIRTPMPNFIDTSGLAREIDPVELMEAVWGALTPMLSKSNVDSILVTGQMAGIAFVTELGEAVAPLVSWQDERGGNIELIRKSVGVDNVEKLGDGLRLSSPLVRLQSIGVPEGALITSLLAFVAGSLTGTRANTVHVTDAAAWGMYDLKENTWSDKAIEIVGVSKQSLPRVSRFLVPVGAVPCLGSPDIPVYCAIGDQQASLRGAGFGYGQFADFVSVNLATGCQVSVVTESWQATEQLRPYFEDRYLHTVTHLPAGRLLTDALIRTRGSSEEADWQWGLSVHHSDAIIASAVAQIVESIVNAVDRLNARGKPILFSGGLVQRFAPIRESISSILGVPAFTFTGNDAALEGLAVLQLGL